MRRALFVLLLVSCGKDGADAPRDAGADVAQSNDAELDGDDVGQDEGTSEGFTLDDDSAPPRTLCKPLEGTPSDTTLQAKCDAATNPPACPSGPAKAGGLCAPAGLECTYPIENGYEIDRCADGTWEQRYHLCGSTCASSGMVLGEVDACTDEIPCNATSGTDVERASAAMHDVIDCCGVTWGSFEIDIVDGCIRRLRANASTSPSSVACWKNSLLGHRLACAGKTTCASTFFEVP
jgi:hypothetical protein